MPKPKFIGKLFKFMIFKFMIYIYKIIKVNKNHKTIKTFKRRLSNGTQSD